MKEGNIRRRSRSREIVRGGGNSSALGKSNMGIEGQKAHTSNGVSQGRQYEMKSVDCKEESVKLFAAWKVIIPRFRSHISRFGRAQRLSLVGSKRETKYIKLGISGTKEYAQPSISSTLIWESR
jgi:hypothetical protein